MKSFLVHFRLLLPLAPVVALLPMIWQPVENRPGINPVQTSDPSNTTPELLRWQDYLQYRPSLAPHHDALLKLSKRLPLEKFTALHPAMQQRLAKFTANRLDPDSPAMTLCWAPGVSMEVMEAFHTTEEMAAQESP
ncbi:hypothetical protein N9B29_01410, partial [bacterium]|nr:hypothetical protein [bacterium]